MINFMMSMLYFRSSNSKISEKYKLRLFDVDISVHGGSIKYYM